MAEPRAPGPARRFASVAFGVALALAGAAPVLGAERTIVIDAMQFAPAEMAVKRGDKVTWINRDLVAHTATAAGAFDSGALAPGKSWSWVAGKAGRYAYVCTLHPTMKATLAVE